MNDDNDTNLPEPLGQAPQPSSPEGSGLLGPILFGLGAAAFLLLVSQKSKSSLAYTDGPDSFDEDEEIDEDVADDEDEEDDEDCDEDDEDCDEDEEDDGEDPSEDDNKR